MPSFCRVHPDLRVRMRRDAHMSYAKPALPKWSAQPEMPAFHVTNDTNVTINTVVTIETQVAHGANTRVKSRDVVYGVVV